MSRTHGLVWHWNRVKYHLLRSPRYACLYVTRRRWAHTELTWSDWQAGVRPSLIKAAQIDEAASRAAVERAKNLEQD